MIQKLTKATTRVLATLFAVFVTSGAWAATPVAVWDGDFSSANLSQNGWTLVNWNETHADDWSTVTMDRNNQGLMINSDSGNSGITVLVKYSGLSKSASAHRVLAASCVTSTHMYDRTGITLKSDGTLVGLWNSSTSASSDIDNGTASGSIAASGVMAFTYGSNGTYLYYGSDTASISSTAAWGASSLKAGNDSSNSIIYGATVGGMCNGASRSGYEAAKGMTVSGIAVFNKVLSNAEMISYFWPSEVQTITVNADTSVSAIKAQLNSENYKAIAVSAADGVTIMVDEAFGCIASVSSEGNVKLAAANQPAASYFSGVDFSGVQGALLRSWLSSSVVGVNFKSASGTDVSGALVAADSWIHDNNASGTSTGMFADGLSTLTWSSGGMWAHSGSTFLTGYLDDGANGGNGATIKLSNVPYATYDVIIYCATDSSGKFLAKTVNGTSYTWDSSSGAAVAGTAAWGTSPQTTAAYGTNALRVKNLTGPLTIYGTARNGSNRGGIAAFEIINTTHEATISSADEYTLAGLFTSVNSDENYVINVNESATLSIASATTVKALTFNVASGKTLTLTGSNTLTVNDGLWVTGEGDVNLTGAAVSGTLKGDGTVVYTAAPSGVTLTDATWTGTVWLKGIGVTDFRTDSYANSSSGAKVKVSGVTGWISTSYDSNAELILEDDTYGFAFKVTNANSISEDTDRCSRWKKLSGSGLLTTGDNNYQTPCVKIYDASGFTGSINANAGNVKLIVVFCAEDEIFSPSIFSRLGNSNGKILVSTGSSGVSVAAGKTWTAPGGIFIDGSLMANAGATIPAIGSGSSGVVQITSSGTATISGVKDNAISSSLAMVNGNIAVVDAGITELTIPAETGVTFFSMGNGKLDLSGCTSLTTLKLNLGSGTTFDLANVILPASFSTVLIDAGTSRDLTSGYAISNLGTATLGFSVTETKEEYANGTFSLSNVPSGANVSVARADGTTSNAIVTDGTARFADYGTVKISGAATDIDWDFTDGTDDALEQAPSGVGKGADSEMTFYVDAEDSTNTGVYIKHHPYVTGAATFMHNNSAAISVAAVGTMSNGSKDIFMNFGSAYANQYGLLLATTENTDEVLVAYNYGATVTPITTMTVPNAATARHVYIITKEDGDTYTTFTVYLDGIKWKTVTTNFKIEFANANTGIQFGSDFGGNIRNAGYNAVSGDTGILNVLRVYGRILTPAEIAAYTTAYPYTSPNGSSARTFTTAAENWIDTTESSEVWSNSDDTKSGTPLVGASLNVTANVATEVTVNLASETAYESLTIGGAATTFKAGTADIKVTGMTVIGTTVTNEYGAFDMTGGPMTITEDGDITFDYSAYDISSIYTTTDIPLTSDVDEDSTKVHLIAPSASYRTASLVYTSGHYAMRVTPDHEAGSEVYYKSGYFGKGGDQAFSVVLSDGTTPTAVFEGDTVVIDDKSSQDPIYVGELPDNVEAIKIARTCSLASGNASNAMLDGAVVTVADGVVATVQYNWNNINLGTVAFNKVGDAGTGSVAFDNNNGTLSVSGAVTGTAPITIATGKTVNVPSTGSIANTVVGDGRIVFEGALPSGSALLTSLQDSSNWTGTVELKNYTQATETDAHKIINLGNYGNSSSTVALNGVTSTMYTGNNTYPDVTLGAIEIGEGGWSDNDGLSYTVSPLYKANLTGHGTITVKTGNAGTVRFVGNHTFDGSVAFGANTGKQVAFMKTDSDTLSSVTAKAIVVAGRTNMSIASGKTWTADAIKLDGSLTVLTAEKATATSVTPTAYLDGASLTTTVDGEAGTTTYVTDEVTQISDNQATLGAVTVSEPMRMTGSGGALMSSLTINDGMTLTYDPVVTPLRVESAPVFNGTGKLKLAARYAGVTCGKFHLVTYPSAQSVSGTLHDLVDSTSFNNATYTVTEETVGDYKQLVLKVGDYDNDAKEMTIAQFGDSITEGIIRDGYRGTPNYRIPLMQLLEAYGYKPAAKGYRSVGSTDANGVPADANYKWHTGISAQRIYTGLTDGNLRAGFMESIEAHLEQVGVTDIITLKIGTNDSIGGETADNMFEGWSNLVWKIVRMRPTSKIVVCAPVKIRKGNDYNAPGLRTKIADYVAKTAAEGGFPDGQVTMINGFNVVTDDANYYLQCLAACGDECIRRHDRSRDSQLYGSDCGLGGERDGTCGLSRGLRQAGDLHWLRHQNERLGRNALYLGQQQLQGQGYGPRRVLRRPQDNGFARYALCLG